MKFTKEMIEKAKVAKSAEELAEMAKAENVEMTESEVAKVFAELHKKGELADDELDNVSGGCANRSSGGMVESADKVEFLYEVGRQIEVVGAFGTTKTAVITKRFVHNSGYDSLYYPKYTVEYKDGSGTVDVWQSDIQIP